MFKWLRNRIELLKNDKQLALIMLLHIVLIGLHVYEWKVGDEKAEAERLGLEIMYLRFVGGKK